MIFHGCAPVYSKKQDSINAALEDAAKKIAVFIEAEGKVNAKLSIGAGYLDYEASDDSALTYGDPPSIDALEFDPEKDVMELNHTVFVRVRYPASAGIPYRASSFSNKTKPAWLTKTPVIAGYDVGVGYANARAKYTDTVTASWENAIFDIVAHIGVEIKNETQDNQGSGGLDSGSSQSHSVLSGGTVRGFYVIDTWTDPENKSVWTLGIAQPN